MTENIPNRRTEATMAMTTRLTNLATITVEIPQHVLFQELEGEAVLLDVQSGGYFGLNEVGTFVWQKLSEKQNISTIIHALCAHYDVDETKASADVNDFLSLLREQQLVTIHEQTN